MRGKAADHSRTGIADLGRELSRLKARAARQKRKAGSGTREWQAWSGTVDEGLRVAVRLAAAEAADIPDLAIQFSAILWVIETNDSLADSEDLQHLRAFDRSLRGFARRP